MVKYNIKLSHFEEVQGNDTIAEFPRETMLEKYYVLKFFKFKLIDLTHKCLKRISTTF